MGSCPLNDHLSLRLIPLCFWGLSGVLTLILRRSSELGLQRQRWLILIDWVLRGRMLTQ